MDDRPLQRSGRKDHRAPAYLVRRVRGDARADSGAFSRRTGRLPPHRRQGRVRGERAAPRRGLAPTHHRGGEESRGDHALRAGDAEHRLDRGARSAHAVQSDQRRNDLRVTHAVEPEGREGPVGGCRPRPGERKALRPQGCHSVRLQSAGDRRAGYHGRAGDESAGAKRRRHSPVRAGGRELRAGCPEASITRQRERRSADRRAAGLRERG